MLFNSIQFLIFFPVVTLIYFLLPHKFRWVHLLLASCIFYAAFIPVYILILLLTIIIDYCAGIFIENSKSKTRRKHFLIASIITNIGVLAIFKYYNFFIDNFNTLFHSLNITTHTIPLLDIILPIGLSFHTFQAMSYTIEVYRGTQKAERHFGIYSLYVMFYPQLVAGPIERPQNLLHQFREEHKFNIENFLTGSRLMLWGLFKKIVIADRLALYVNSVYNFPSNFHYLNLIIATLFFTIQIYCDFSGYSDIAIGAARTMGFKLMTNFNRPYFSKNIQEFWKRWHISLSTWFKDYLYIALGGNKVPKYRVYINVAIVFLVSGFWHGANWTYIVWGALHTVYILTYMYFNNNFKYKSKPSFLKSVFQIIFTFIIVSFAWIFFRANNMEDAFTIIGNIFHLSNIHPYQSVVVNLSNSSEFGMISTLISLVMIAIMFIIEYRYKPLFEELNPTPLADVFFCTFCIIAIVLFGVFYNNSFIYFQF